MPAEITVSEMAAELRRELAMRERVYPSWVAKGTLAKPKADRQIALLKAAIEKLEEKLSWDEIKGGA